MGGVGIVYQDQYVLLLCDAVRFPDGLLGTCIRSVDEHERAPGVVVLPLHQGQVLLIRHFRHGSRTWHLEVPQGFGLPGLSSEESIRLELQPEISATLSRLVSLGRFHPHTPLVQMLSSFSLRRLRPMVTWSCRRGLSNSYQHKYLSLSE